MCMKECSIFRQNEEHNWYCTMVTRTRQTKNPFPGNDHETGSVRCIIVVNVEHVSSPEMSTALKQSDWLYISIHIRKCILVIKNCMFYQNKKTILIFSDKTEISLCYCSRKMGTTYIYLFKNAYIKNYECIHGED